MKAPDLPELLMQTTLDAHQAAHVTGLPVALVRGCEDVLTGTALDGDALRALSDADRDDYCRGQRLADAWFYATADRDAAPVLHPREDEIPF